MSDKVTWIHHIPGDRPVDGATLVECMMENGDILGPMAASCFDWDCPGDQVDRYRIRNSGRGKS